MIKSAVFVNEQEEKPGVAVREFPSFTFFKVLEAPNCKTWVGRAGFHFGEVLCWITPRVGWDKKGSSLFIGMRVEALPEGSEVILTQGGPFHG